MVQLDEQRSIQLTTLRNQQAERRKKLMRLLSFYRVHSSSPFGVRRLFGFADELISEVKEQIREMTALREKIREKQLHEQAELTV